MILAKGEYLGFLNSDDRFTENALDILNKYILLYQIKILFLEQFKSTGVFYMDINI